MYLLIYETVSYMQSIIYKMSDTFAILFGLCLCGLRICLTVSVPLPKSCTVSDINLLFCAKNHTSGNVKGNALLILYCQDKMEFIFGCTIFRQYGNENVRCYII